MQLQRLDPGNLTRASELEAGGPQGPPAGPLAGPGAGSPSRVTVTESEQQRKPEAARVARRRHWHPT